MFEYFGVILSIVGVLLATQRSLWAGPFYIVACILYGFIYYQEKLYADSILQVVFMVIAFYGWVTWIVQYLSQRAHPRAPALLVVHSLPQNAPYIAIGVTIVGTLLWGGFLQCQTEDPFPFLDAGLSIASLVGSYWTAKRYRACWLLWIVIDTIYCGIYFDRGLYPTMGLYSSFVLLSFYGYWSWNEKEEEMESAS